MTVSAVARRVAYTGNGATLTFAAPFQFFEIEVYLDGVLKTFATHYTITQTTPGTTGSVNFLVAPAMGLPVVLVAATAQVQDVDFTDNDSFPAETAERALDRLTMAVQEATQVHGRTLRAPAYHDEIPALDYAANPDSFVATDGDGVPLLAPITGPLSPLTPVLEAAQLAAEQAVLAQDNAENFSVAAANQVALAEAQKDLAEIARNAAEDLFDQFGDLFLGVKPAEPIVDNDGDALQIGAIYFDSTINASRIYTVDGWEGLTGPQGIPGNAATIAVGTVTTLAPGEDVEVDNVGTSSAAVFDFAIPQGDPGVDGIDGDSFVPRGAYSGVTAYDANDVVDDAGSSWIALVSTTGNAPPSLPTTSNAFWTLNAAKGTDGAGTGDVVGPASATADNIATFDTGTGKLIQDGGQSIADVIAAAVAASGDVVGPASSVDDRIATFDGVTGKLLQDGGKTIAGLLSDAGDVDGPASSIDDYIAVFDGTTGKLLKSGGQTVAQAIASAVATVRNSVGAAFDTLAEIATELALKAYASVTLTAGSGLTGGGDLSANRTFAVGAGTGMVVNADDVAVDKASAANVRAAASNKVVTTDIVETASAFVALTDATTVAVDWDAGINFALTVTANRIIGNPTNGQPGTWRTIYVLGNDATDRTITFGNQYLGGVPTITDAYNARGYLLMIFCITTTHFSVSSKKVVG